MNDNECPFCFPAADRVFFEGDNVLGLWDSYPVSNGHALIITKRHVTSWFDANDDEHQELLSSVNEARSAIGKNLVLMVSILVLI